MKMKARALWGFHHNSENVREGQTIEVDEETFKALEKNGLVELATGDATPAGGSSDASGSGSSAGAGIDLSGMKLEELRKFAADQGIDLGEAKTKDETQAAIKAAQAAKA